MPVKLFVGGISWGTTSDSLKDLFAKIGNVVSAVVITDKFSGKSKGFGFVEMETEEEALEAIKQLDGTEFDGRNIMVNKARPREEGGDRGGDRGPRRDFSKNSFRQ